MESCTSARGVPLAVFSLLVWGHGGGAKDWGYVAGPGGMWQGVGACGRVWGHVVGGQTCAWTEKCGRGGNMW